MVALAYGTDGRAVLSAAEDEDDDEASASFRSMTSDEEQYTIEALNTLSQQKILTVFNMIESYMCSEWGKNTSVVETYKAHNKLQFLSRY